MKEEIKKWLNSKLKNSDFKLPVSIEFDEIGSLMDPTNSSQLFNCMVIGFNEVVKILNQREIKNVQFDMQCELFSSSNFISKPNTLEDLLNLFSNHSTPEVLISRPNKAYWLPILDYYVTPLNFKEIEPLIKKGYVITYSQYKDESDEEYVRWLNLTFENLEDK